MIELEVSPGAQADAAAEEQLIDGHLTVPGGLEWDETPVERHTIANLRYAGGKEHDVRYVSEVHLDAALAREAALRESLTDKRDEYNKLGDRYDALQQRLTVAEQRADDLESLLRNAQSFVEQWDDDSQEWMDLSSAISNSIPCDSSAALKPAADGGMVVSNLKFCYRCLVASIWSVKRDSKNKIDRMQCACGCHVFIQGGKP